MSKFESIKIGDFAEVDHLVTQQDVEKFIDLTGDDNKIHFDNEYTEKTSFKKPIVHGMLGASFISTIIGTKLPGDGALWYSQTLEFLLPVRVGDRINVRATVIDKIENLNAIELETIIYNQDRQKVIKGKAKVRIVDQIAIPQSSKPLDEQVKVALVIGGSGGIGSEACLKLAELGYDVAVHYNSNRKNARNVQQRIQEKGKNALLVTGDITDKKTVEEIVLSVRQRLGRIFLMVNCATVRLSDINFESLMWSDFQRQIDVNLVGNFLLAKELVPEMKRLRGGKFIFLTTEATENVPPKDWMPYVVAKSGLNGFAKSLAIELAAFNINVNLVSPGLTDTSLIADIPEKSRMLLAARTPLKRLASPSEIASVIGFLASNDSNYITGETIRVNGGKVML